MTILSTRDNEHMCLRKRVFWTEYAARERGRKLKLRAYPCPNCKQWHLTKLRTK